MVGAGDGKTNWFSSRREQQPVKRDPVAPEHDHFAHMHIELESRLPKAGLNIVLDIKMLVFQGDVFEGNGTRKVVLREVGTIIRQGIVAAEHDDAVLVSNSPKHFSCCKSRCTAADDNNFFRMGDGRTVASLLDRILSLFAHRNLPVVLLDVPACNWAKRRRPKGFSVAQIETGVMPRAAHRVANQEALCKRTLIMRAMRGDGEDFVYHSH